MSVGADITFPGSAQVYGVPEHATQHALKTTRGGGGSYSEPYRLYNLDVFEYELDEPMALYGSIPVMVAHGASGSAGVFWNNPSETFVDVESVGSGRGSRWMSESGVVDLWLLPGPSPHAVFSQYTDITGRQALPPMFALAYHQCRWNYRDEADVFDVDSKFEEFNFPYDVLWLDIEHTNGKRYFTWDKNLFPNPADMQRKLAERGRKMVTIVDPHMKRSNDYRIHTEATAKGLYVKNKGGSDFNGWCWPGDSSYLDFTSPHVREWWVD
jgi:alpha 1,3-glucosidase